MATREMAIALPIFNREIKNFTQISTIVPTIILHQHFGFLLVQTKNNENHEFSHFFPEFIALSRKMNLTENNCKSPWYSLFWPKELRKYCLHGILNTEYKNSENLESALGKCGYHGNSV